jgi:hypothetical protein
MIETTKQFATLRVASAMTGIGLCAMKYSDIQEILEHALGAPVWTHEIIGRTGKDAVAALRAMFPDMPTQEDAEADWRAAATKALAAYGQTVSIQRGTTYARHAGPVETLVEVAPHAEVITVLTP